MFLRTKSSSMAAFRLPSGDISISIEDDRGGFPFGRAFETLVRERNELIDALFAVKDSENIGRGRT